MTSYPPQAEERKEAAVDLVGLRRQARGEGGEQEARRPSRTADDGNTELSPDAKLRVLTC